MYARVLACAGQTNTRAMHQEPFRRCDYCHTELPGNEPWILHNNTRKLSCPDCAHQGRAEDENAAFILRQYGELLHYRLVADAPPPYGDPMHLRFAHIKAKYPDVLMLLCDNDQYFAIGADALRMQHLLGLVPVRVYVGEDQVSLVRFPAHALDMYLPALVRAGHRVGLCDPAQATDGPSVAAEPFGDAPLPRTHTVKFKGQAVEVDMSLSEGRYYSLDGTWDVATTDRSIQRVVRRAGQYEPALYGYEHDGSMAAEPVGRYERIERKNTIERLSTIITVLKRHDVLPRPVANKYLLKDEEERAEAALNNREDVLRAELKLHAVWLCRYRSLHFRLVRAKVNVPLTRLPALLAEYRSLCNRADRDPWPLRGAPSHAIGNFETPEQAQLTLRYAEENLITARAYGFAPDLVKHFTKHVHEVQLRVESINKIAA